MATKTPPATPTGTAAETDELCDITLKGINGMLAYLVDQAASSFHLDDEIMGEVPWDSQISLTLWDDEALRNVLVWLPL